MSTPYIRKIKSYNIADSGDVIYTDESIRECALRTANKYGITVEEVYTQVLLVYDENRIKAQLPKEVRDIIYGLVEKDDATYKALLEVNKSAHKKYRPKKSEHFNQLWTLINAYPNKWWNWDNIFLNANTGIKQVEKIIEWNKNPHHPYGKKIKIEWRLIACNPGITDFKFVEKHLSLKQWNNICANSKFIFNVIEKHPKFKWDWYELSRNRHIPIEFVKKHVDKDWGWNFVSACRNITIKDIEANPAIPWSNIGISGNPNLTIKYLDEHIDEEDWRWGSISENPGIKMSDIEERLADPRYKWVLRTISANPNLTIKFLLYHLNDTSNTYDSQWYWSEISRNPGIKIKDIGDNPKLPWIMKDVFMNPNFTTKHGKRYLDKHKDEHNAEFFRSFSSNINLTAEFVQEHASKFWDWDAIADNFFEKAKYYEGPRK